MIALSHVLTSSPLFLFSTHITRTKIIAGVVVLVVIVAAGVWFVMRQRRRQA